MTQEEGLKELARLFHRTRLTKLIYVPGEVVAAVLGYNNGKRD